MDDLSPEELDQIDALESAGKRQCTATTLISQEEWEEFAALDEAACVMAREDVLEKEREKETLKRLYGVFWILHTRDKEQMTPEWIRANFERMQRKNTRAAMADNGILVRGTALHTNNETYLSLLPPNLLEVVAHYTETCESLPGCVEYFVDQRSEIWFLLRKSVGELYPTTAKRVTGSIIAAIIGVSPFGATPRDIFRSWVGELSANESDFFGGNQFTQAGVLYEPRVFEIFSRLICPDARTPGFYTHKQNEKLGVSPDAVTPEIALLLDGYNARRLDKKMMDFKGRRWVYLGTTIAEFKTSIFFLKEKPKAEHILQMYLEMYIPGMDYGWLFYWHADKVCLWIVKFDAQLWKWVEHRVERFLYFVRLHHHVRTHNLGYKVELDNDAAAHIAFEVQDEWFPRDPRYPAVWGRKIAHLRPPVKPLVIEVWREDTTRCEEFTDETFNDARVFPVVLPPGDDWFRRRWSSVCEEQTRGEWEFTIHALRFGEDAKACCV
jgi:hypothetical protein